MQNWKEVNVWSSTVYSCDFREGRQHFITLLFVLNFVLFFNLFTLVIFTIFHHIVEACVEFCFLKKQFLNLTINMQLLYFITTVTSQVHTPTACGLQCSTERLVHQGVEYYLDLII